MEILTEEEIFEVLDGVASAQVQTRHEVLMERHTEYRVYFESLQTLHESLLKMPLESPSMSFERNLMAKVAYSKRPIYLQPPIIVMSLLCCICLMAVLWIPTQQGSMTILIKLFSLNSLFGQAILAFNIVLLWLVVEKIWIKRLGPK